MKLYCKIKVDGVWQWYVGDQPWKVATARALCECRVCRPGKPETISYQGEESICLGGANAQELIDHFDQENPPSSEEE